MTAPENQNKIVALVDGSNSMHRYFHAFKNFTSVDGTPTGALYGTIKALNNLQSEYQPDIVIFFTDYSRKSFRTDLYPRYKGNRSETDPNLRLQFKLMEEFCEMSGLLCCKQENYEADDLIGSYARTYADNGYEVLVFSGDKDLFQLIDDEKNIKLVYASTKEGNVIYDNAKCKEKFGLNPKQIIDLKGICGDASDNYKGIPGVGEKTAVKLLQEFGSLDGIYENIDNLKGKIKEKFAENKEDAYLCLKLATIDCNIEGLVLPNESLMQLSEDVRKFLKEKYSISHV